MYEELDTIALNPQNFLKQGTSISLVEPIWLAEDIYQRFWQCCYQKYLKTFRQQQRLAKIQEDLNVGFL